MTYILCQVDVVKKMNNKNFIPIFVLSLLLLFLDAEHRLFPFIFSLDVYNQLSYGTIIVCFVKMQFSLNGSHLSMTILRV